MSDQQNEEDPTMAMASAHDESAVLAMESGSLAETNSSADFDLQNETFDSKHWRADSDLNSSADESIAGSMAPAIAPVSTAIPPTPSKNIEQGVILKQLLFKGITNQLNMAQSKLKCKEATCLTVSSWIAVGTRNGLVLVFDVTQNLKWYLDTLDVLGTKEEGSNGPSSQDDGSWGHAISALALSGDNARLLVGNGRGNVLEYDMKDGKLVRTLNDVHPPDAAILHLKFTDSPTLALLCDSGGSVFELSFKRTLGLRGGVETRCLFSGSRGEVCAVEPLKAAGMDPNIVHGIHSKWEESILVAMATLSKVLIVQIRPSTKVVASQPLTGDGLSPPCLSWHFLMLGRQGRVRSIDPVLAVGRHEELHFIQLSADEQRSGRIRSHPLLRFKLDFNLRGLQWLDGRMLALMDSERQVHVVDIKSRETIDTVDVSSLDLVTAAPFFQGRATGGNVSQALALVGTGALHNSLASCAGQLLLQCATSLRSIGIRSWDDRLDLLATSQSGRIEEALRLGLRMLDGRAKAMHSIKGNLQQKRKLIKHKVISILNQYVERSLVPLLDGHHSGGRLESVIELIIHVCIQLEANSLLFDQIYPTLSPYQPARSIFLEQLEPHLLNDRLPSVPPSVMQQWVAHYEEIGRLEALEDCVTHVEVSSLDLHQILTLSGHAGLYSAYLYVHNRALLDYVGPLEDLMKQLAAAVHQLGPPYSEQDLKLGHTVLVYLSCCLAGQAYPVGGQIEPVEARLKVKHQILSFLTCLHSKCAPDDEPAYPYLRLLLEFNTQELLNALSLAFEESEFTGGEMGVRRQQRVVDILVEIMIQPTSQFSPDQICSLFTFIARQIGRATGDGGGESIHLDRVLFHQLVDLVCEQSAAAVAETARPGPVQSRFEERQQALLRLLQVKGGQMNAQDEDKLLAQARSAHFYRVCEYLYEQRQDWERVVDCYVEDPGRHSDILPLLRRLSTSSVQADKMVDDAILKHNRLLAGLDAPGLTLFLAVDKPHLMLPVIEALGRQSEASWEQYRFLESVVELANHQDDLVRISQEDGSRLVGQYSRLMAQLEPARLAIYVQSVDAQHLSNLLDVCREFLLVEAEAALLERQGETGRAYELLLGRLRESVDPLFDPSGERARSWDLFRSASQSVFDFCQRQAGRMSEEDRERVWLTLLDHLLAPQRTAKEQPDAEFILSGLREATQRVVTGLQGQVDLTKVLARLIRDPQTTGGTLGDLRHLLMGLLDNYTYETTLLRVSTRLLQGDVHALLAQRVRQSTKAVCLRTDRCSLCRQPLTRSATSIAFRQPCRHAFHSDCLPESIDGNPQCILCHPVATKAAVTGHPSLTSPERRQRQESLSNIKLSPIQLEAVAMTRRRLSSAQHDDF